MRQNKKEKVVRALQLPREPTGEYKVAFMSHRSEPARDEDAEPYTQNRRHEACLRVLKFQRTM